MKARAVYLGAQGKPEGTGKPKVRNYQQMLAFVISKEMVTVVRNNGYFVPVNKAMEKDCPRLFHLLSGVHPDSNSNCRTCHFPNHIYCNISNVMSVLQFLLMYSYYYRGKVSTKCFLRLDNEVLDCYLHDYIVRQTSSEFDAIFGPDSDANPAHRRLHVCYKLDGYFYKVNKDGSSAEVNPAHNDWHERFFSCPQSHSIAEFVNIFCSGGHTDLNQCGKAEHADLVVENFLPLWKSAEAAISECDFEVSALQNLRTNKCKEDLVPPGLFEKRPAVASETASPRSELALEVDPYFSKKDFKIDWFANDNQNLASYMENYAVTHSVRGFRAILHTALVACIQEKRIGEEYKYDQDIATHKTRGKNKSDIPEVVEGASLVKFGRDFFSTNKPKFEDYIVKAYNHTKQEIEREADAAANKNAEEAAKKQNEKSDSSDDADLEVTKNTKNKKRGKKKSSPLQKKSGDVRALLTAAVKLYEKDLAKEQSEQNNLLTEIEDLKSQVARLEGDIESLNNESSSD